MKFQVAEPYPHLVLNDFAPGGLLCQASEEFDRVPLEEWHRYTGPDEAGKRTCHRWQAMGMACREVLSWMLSLGPLLEAATGIDGLVADDSLYGGGLHMTEPGGILGCHLDSERHPVTGLARRLNLILYCSMGWQASYGGELQLFDRQRKPVKAITPTFNRAVVFECGPWSYHGHPTPVTMPRKSLAVYYWSAVRERARFVSADGEAWDAEREASRETRSKVIADT